MVVVIRRREIAAIDRCEIGRFGKVSIDKRALETPGQAKIEIQSRCYVPRVFCKYSVPIIRFGLVDVVGGWLTRITDADYSTCKGQIEKISVGRNYGWQLREEGSKSRGGQQRFHRLGRECNCAARIAITPEAGSRRVFKFGSERQPV